MNRSTTAFLLAIAWMTANAVISNASAQSDQPNVLVILTDDQGWGDLSLHGNPNLRTPNIDSLARDGAQIRNFYVCAVCSPTRAEFLTGRYHTRMGVFSTSSGGERFDLAERTIGDVFSDAGYATGAFGKWHSGMQPPYHPNARGFDEFYGFCSGHWGNYFSPMLERNGAIVEGNGFLVDDLTDHAIEFMSQKRDEPFLVYLPLNTPHSPMQVPDQDWAKFEGKEITPDPKSENAKKEDLQHTRAALALCENIDDNVGRLLATIDQLSIRENTIVVFFCDNGPNGARFNGGLRGRKGSVYEGGLRSPGLVRYPKRIAAGTTVDGIAGAIDWLPTLADLCGVSVGKVAGSLDGLSLVDALTGEGMIPDERLIFTAWKGRTSVRSTQYRYHQNGDLFDIQNDRGETRSVANQKPATAALLKKNLEAWVAETQPRKTNGKNEQVFPVGHPDYEWTQLPARDAEASGGIQRSNRYPNSSYFRHWQSTDDAITWDVDVLAGGNFDVDVYYACPQSAVGTRVQLEWSDVSSAMIESTVEQANDSPPIHLEKDRSPRAESDEKRWRPMSLGTIALPAGRGRLTLTCPEIKGDDGIEVRLMMLRRVKNQ